MLTDTKGEWLMPEFCLCKLNRFQAIKVKYKSNQKGSRKIHIVANPPMNSIWLIWQAVIAIVLGSNYYVQPCSTKDVGGDCPF